TILVFAFARNRKPAARSLHPPVLREGARTERVAAAYGKLPLAFEANRGQSGEPVKFVSRASGYTLLLTPTETVLSMTDRRSPVRFKLLGANPRGAGGGPGRTARQEQLLHRQRSQEVAHQYSAICQGAVSERISRR